MYIHRTKQIMLRGISDHLQLASKLLLFKHASVGPRPAFYRRRLEREDATFQIEALCSVNNRSVCDVSGRPGPQCAGPV